MSQTPMVGKGGLVEIGGEQLKFDSWTIDPSDIKELSSSFEAFRYSMDALSVSITGYWSYALDPFYMKAEAKRLRWLRKRWKRYQLQKRKQ